MTEEFDIPPVNESENDMLRILFRKQQNLQIKVNGKQKMDELQKDQAMWQRYINEHTLALFVELGEAIQNTQWKNPTKIEFGWKQTQQTNLNKLKEEIVDCWHFLINITMASGMTAEDLYNFYLNKNLINVKRQDNHY